MLVKTHISDQEIISQLKEKRKQMRELEWSDNRELFREILELERMARSRNLFL